MSKLSDAIDAAKKKRQNGGYYGGYGNSYRSGSYSSSTYDDSDWKLCKGANAPINQKEYHEWSEFRDSAQNITHTLYIKTEQGEEVNWEWAGEVLPVLMHNKLHYAATKRTADEKKFFEALYLAKKWVMEDNGVEQLGTLDIYHIEGNDKQVTDDDTQDITLIQ